MYIKGQRDTIEPFFQMCVTGLPYTIPHRYLVPFSLQFWLRVCPGTYNYNRCLSLPREACMHPGCGSVGLEEGGGWH